MTFLAPGFIDGLNRFFANLWMQNALIALGFGLLAWFLIVGSRNEQWQRAWLRLKRDRIGIASGLFIALYLLIGALETIRVPSAGGSASVLDLLTQKIPVEKSYSAPLAETSLSSTKPEPLRGRHLLGTTALGKDTLVETLKACRTALVLGGLTSAIYIPLGTLFGLLAGYFRRWIDDAVQYVYTVLYSIPEILLLVSIVLVMGKGIGTMAFALGVTSWVGLCRLIRGETMRQAERPYVAAARALGQSHWKIVTRHLLPNVLHLVLIKLVLGFSGIVLAEAVLSYLGVGSPVGTASWGTMIDGARSELSRDPIVWWNLSAATASLFGLVLALNLFGDALRRAFDPKRG